MPAWTDEGVTAGTVAVLALIGALPLLRVDVAVTGLLGGGLVDLLLQLVPVLVLLPLAVGYTALVSRERFRWGALGMAAVLPLAAVDRLFLPVGAGMVLGGLLVSYKARSIYTGDNTFWTVFKASGTLVFIVGLSLGLFAAYTYQQDAAVRGDVQDALLNQSMSIAMEQFDLLAGQQQELMVQQTRQQSRQFARAAIAATARNVTRHLQDEGFTRDELRTVGTAFTRAENEIPGILERRAVNRLQEQFNGTGVGAEQDRIRARVAPVVERFTAPSTPVLVMIVLFMVSLTKVASLPFQLLAGLYGYAAARLLDR